MITSHTKKWAQAAKLVPERPLKSGHHYVSENNGAVYRHRKKNDDKLIIGAKDIPKSLGGLRADTPEKHATMQRYKAMIQMRDLRRDILHLQKECSDHEIEAAGLTQPPWAPLQAKLDQVYDGFFHAFGAINKVEWVNSGAIDEKGQQTQVRRHPNINFFKRDPDFMALVDLEIYDEETGLATKADIFTKRVARADESKPRSIINTPQDALHYCFSVKQCVDIAYLTELMPNLPINEIIDTLAKDNAIFLNPKSETWETRAVYLSGDLRDKINVATDALAQNPSMQTNIDALKSACRKPFAIKDIDAQLRSPWIPTEIFEQFAAQELGISDAKIHYIPQTHKFFVYGDIAEPFKAEFEFGTQNHNAIKLLENALDDRPAGISINARADFDMLSDKAKEQIFAGERQSAMDVRFKNWLWGDKERAKAMQDHYNDLFTTFVPYEGSDEPILASGQSVNFTLRPNQNRVASRSMNGNMANTQDVGAGKTHATIKTLTKLKERGDITMGAFVIPNNKLLEVGGDWKNIFPASDIFVLEPDLFDNAATLDKRLKKAIHRLKNNDYDGVVMTHSQMDALGVSVQTKLQMRLEDAREFKALLSDERLTSQKRTTHYIQTQMDKKLDEIVELFSHPSQDEAANDNTPDNLLTRQKVLEMLDHDSSHKKWRKYLKNHPDAHRKTIEDLPISAIALDEVQHYKNCRRVSRHQGLGIEGSARANGLKEILWYLRRKNPTHYFYPMSATPVSNTISEIFTIFDQVAPDFFKSRGFHCFDAKAAMFTNMETTTELNPSSNGYRSVNRIASYTNTDILSHFYKCFTDTTEAKLDLPTIANKDSQIITIKRPASMDAFMEELFEQTKMCGGPDTPNILEIMTNARKATADPSSVGIKLKDGEKSKADIVVDLLAENYYSFKDNVYYDAQGNIEENTGALQLIFSEFGIPKREEDISVYREIKQKLIKKGLPANSIRFIHDFGTPKKKAQFFKDCNQGRISVAISTTKMLGEGTNIPKRLIALYHLDSGGWKPSDYIQRMGRMLRQGNQNKLVYNYLFNMKDSFDGVLLQTLERKLRSFVAIKHPNASREEIEELEPLIATYAEAKMSGFGDPLWRDLVDIEAALSPLQNQKQSHDHQVARAQEKLSEANLSDEDLERYGNAIQRIFEGQDALDKLEARYNALNAKVLEAENAASTPDPYSTNDPVSPS